VIGDAGETAVIAYDARIRTLQEFTSDSDKVAQAVKKIQPGSQSSRMVDAVMAGTRLLQTRPKNRRRIMLLIGETRDLGSETRTRDALVALQMHNVEFYSVDMSRFINVLTAPARVGRPDPMPPAMRPLPSNVPATPTTVQQTWGTNGGSAEFIPLFVEIFRDAKAVFKANPVELFTKGTGGTEFGFHSQRTLEDALTAIGEQLHSQYTITYSPNNKNVGGWHTIQVQVVNHPEVDKIVTRPGYYIGALY
jgi:VWFA-related protein